MEISDNRALLENLLKTNTQDELTSLLLEESLLETATPDELTGLWALGYDLFKSEITLKKKKATLDKNIGISFKPTISLNTQGNTFASKSTTSIKMRLISHLTDNLNILFGKKIASQKKNNILLKIETDSGIKTITILEKTVLAFVNKHNPLLYLTHLPEPEHRDPLGTLFVSGIGIDLRGNTAHGNHLRGNPAHGNHLRGNPAHGNHLRGNPAHGNHPRSIFAQGGYVGIKKSRRKKRKRTKRKRTKRKRTKRKRTKRKRSKYKGGVNRDGSNSHLASFHESMDPPPWTLHRSQSSTAFPLHPPTYQEVQQQTIYDRLQTTDTILRPIIGNQRWAFAKAQGWGVNLRTYGRTYAGRGLPTNRGCRDNTGNLVKDLLSGNNDSISIIGSPGPDFSQSHPITYWNQKTNLKTILDKTRHNIPNVFVVILEDENFYRATNGLGFYRTIHTDNRELIHGIDMKPHDPKQFLQLINFIVGKVSTGLPTIIIIHCFCGAGRTSSMILCSKLYFLIKSISKVIMRSADKQNTCLDIPSLIGIHDGGGTPDQSSINNSPAGKWLLDNYKSHDVRALKKPGEEFLKITSNFSKTLFLNRVNNMSSALAEHFGFGSHITPYFDSTGRRIQVGNQNVQYFFGKNPTYTSNLFTFYLYHTN